MCFIFPQALSFAVEKKNWGKSLLSFGIIKRGTCIIYKYILLLSKLSDFHSDGYKYSIDFLHIFIAFQHWFFKT